jgi:hypothetical protein
VNAAKHGASIQKLVTVTLRNPHVPYLRQCHRTTRGCIWRRCGRRRVCNCWLLRSICKPLVRFRLQVEGICCPGIGSMGSKGKLLL